MASSSSTSVRPMASSRNTIDLLTNHFEVNFTKSESQHFFQYSVAITYEDKEPVKGKGIGRKILAKVQDGLGSKHFAYDGDKILYTVGPLAEEEELDFPVVLEDMSCSKSDASTSDATIRRPGQSKRFNVAISFAAKISFQAIKGILQEDEPNDLPDAVRALDAILRQNAATKDCLLVRQSFFKNEAKYLSPAFGGFQRCKGFNSSFRATQRGLSLNIDVSSTLLVQPGPIIGFLIANQDVNDQSFINWKKAERTLKNLRVKISHSNRECKITGLSELTCRDQKFIRKQKQENGEAKEVEVTVYDYFTNHLGTTLRYSGDFLCINVGKPKRPTYIPMELCHLVPLQRYTKALTSSHKSRIVKEPVQNPKQRMDTLSNAIKDSGYNNDPMLQECGVRIGSDFTQVQGRILPTPNLKAGRGRDLFPEDARWNFIEETFAVPATVTRWAVVNFSAQCNPHRIIHDLIRCGKKKGMNVEPPYPDVFEESSRLRDAPAHIRVEKMFEEMQSKLGKTKLLFLLCILAEKKNSLVYGPWKKKMLVDEGIVTQCIAPTKINDQYLTNVLLKINAKLGGLNSVLAWERSREMMPLAIQVPTFIVGMDVSHGSPGSDEPSIAAVVGSRQWPLVSKYRACVRTQSRRTEMIANLFNTVTNEEGELVDEGIFGELLWDFYTSSGERKPEHIIIFRDGVSESQFTQVLDIELAEMKQACKFFGDKVDAQEWKPKFTVIISVKRHHTRFFQKGRNFEKMNVPPGTIVDSNICSPYSNDFYLCAHNGILGTSRPIHYHVLRDDIGFSTDDLQELVHSLSYVYQRSTNAISQVAPVMYAHLAAAQMRTAMKFEDSSETSSSHGGITTSGEVPVPPMPTLHPDVASSMFFC